MKELEHLTKPDLEKSVLSSFMLDPDDFFNVDAHEGLFTGNRGLVFGEIKNLIADGQAPDLVTLTSRLIGMVKASELSDISDAPCSPNIQFHLGQLEEARARREMYKAFTKAITLCKEGADLKEIDQLVKSKVHGIETFKPAETSDLVSETLETIEQEALGKIETGLKTGLRQLDHIMNGFIPTELVLIAARPGVGKTSLALNIARNFAFSGHPGMVFSLEMSRFQLMRRMMCDVGNIDGRYLLQNRLKATDKGVWAALHEASARIVELPIIWDDSASVKIETIYSRAKKAKAQKGIRWVVVDYLQLITGWTTPGQEAKSEISRQLKVMAKELDVVVIALSQLNRNIEGRKDRVPMMSDLRDSGSLEQDADCAIFPDVEKSVDGVVLSGDGYEPASLYIVKTRRGARGVIQGMKWQGQYFRYSDGF